jgi:hypothetical protein
MSVNLKRRAGRPAVGDPLTVHLTPEQIDYVVAEARREDRPVSQVVRLLVGEAIASRARKTTRR